MRNTLIGVFLALTLFFGQYWLVDIPTEIAVLASIACAAMVLWLLARSSKQSSTKTDTKDMGQGQSIDIYDGSEISGTILQGNIIESVNITTNQITIQQPEQSPPPPSGSISFRQVEPPEPPLTPTETRVVPSPVDDAKQQIVRRIKEALEHLHNRQFEEARTQLFEILADIKKEPGFERERARVFNNLGVSYNQPDEYGHTELAKKFFHQALGECASFYQAKLNLGLARIGENSKESIQKGYETIFAVWESQKDNPKLKPEEIDPLIGAIVWATFRHKGSQEGVDLINGLDERLSEIASKNMPVARLRVSMLAETGSTKSALDICDISLKESPDDPELLFLKARIFLQKSIKDGGDIKDLELIPEIEDKTDIESSLELFKKAEHLASEQNKPYLMPEIHLSIVQCQVLLGKFHEAPATLKLLESAEFPPEFRQHLIVLQFTTCLQNRQFDKALSTLQDDPNFSGIPYGVKKLFAQRFIRQGAPEQASQILTEIEAEAIELKDISYWFDIALIKLFLDRKTEAISAANRAKTFADQSDLDHDDKKEILSNYAAIIYRYVRMVGKDEGGRLLPAILEFQKEFPDENIVIPVKAIDEQGQLTDEIKRMFTDQVRARVQMRDAFKKSPIPTYVLVHQRQSSYPDFICNRNDPEFTIEMTIPDIAFVDRLINTFKHSDTLLFDYLSLLDLSRSDLLGFLERCDKKIVIHQKLFERIQDDLIMLEVPELRRLWDFLRRSTNVVFITDESDVRFKIGDISPFMDDWLVKTIKYAKATRVTIVTDDLRLLKFLESESVTGINICTLLDHLIETEQLDKRAYSAVLGKLAERFFVFLSFDHEDLAEIVAADDYKITPRSYHLCHQILLPGSEWNSFSLVFARYTKILWRADILITDKLEWLEFLTRTIFQLVERAISEDPDADLMPLANGIGLMWKEAIDSGSKDDLEALLPRIDEIIDEDKLPDIGELFRKRIRDRLDI